MTRVLVVADESPIADLVALDLRHDGHEVERIADGLAAPRRLAAAADAVDLVVLDPMLPGLDGRGLCRRLGAFGDRLDAAVATGIMIEEERAAREAGLRDRLDEIVDQRRGEGHAHDRAGRDEAGESEASADAATSPSADAPA